MHIHAYPQLTHVLCQSSKQVTRQLCLTAGNAGTWWDTSVLVTNVRNFPDDRGSVMGILKVRVRVGPAHSMSLCRRLALHAHMFVGMSTSICASV